MTVSVKAIIYSLYNQLPQLVMPFIFSVLQQTCLCMQLVCPVGSQKSLAEPVVSQCPQRMGICWAICSIVPALCSLPPHRVEGGWCLSHAQTHAQQACVHSCITGRTLPFCYEQGFMHLHKYTVALMYKRSYRGSDWSDLITLAALFGCIIFRSLLLQQPI